MKQLIEKSRVELQTLERLEDELFKGKDAQFVKMKGLITQLIVRLKTEVNCISEYNEEMSENPETDNMSSSTMFTSPGEIDEAGFVDTMSTLNESKNTETNRAKLRDTLEGMHDQEGINIHEDTSEESETDTIKGPNNVDSKSKGLNCQNCEERTYINKQSPNLTEDATDGVYANKGDLVVQVPQVQGARQSAGMLQADEKQPENDVSGRVSESQKCFRLGTQFRDTSREHSTLVQDTQNTHIEHHQRNSTCTTVITDDELINDDEGKMEEGEQGGDKAIHARYGNRMQAMTEKELRRLMEENSGKYVVYDGKIITPGSIKQLKNHTIVRIVDKMMGGGRKKGHKKQKQRRNSKLLRKRRIARHVHQSHETR